jgi:hypothetical protein
MGALHNGTHAPAVGGRRPDGPTQRPQAYQITSQGAEAAELGVDLRDLPVNEPGHLGAGTVTSIRAQDGGDLDQPEPESLGGAHEAQRAPRALVVSPGARERIDRPRLDQPDRVVVAQRRDREPEFAGKLSDPHRSLLVSITNPITILKSALGFNEFWRKCMARSM